MTGKKKKIVQPAEPKETAKKSEPAAEQPAVEYAEPEVTAEPAKSPIDLPQDLLDQAKVLGVDLQQIVDWAKGMEEFKRATMENFDIIQRTFDKLEPLVQLSAQVQQAQAQQPMAGSPPQTGQGGALGGIMQLIPYILQGGGGGGNEQLQKLAMDALTNQINMSSAITNAVVAKITGKATSEVAEVVTGA